MTQAADIAPMASLDSPQLYFNRELSWLLFNDRVLHEAIDHRTPFLERLKFAAIFSSNLDEFFMVRVSGLMEQVRDGIMPETADKLTPTEVVEAIQEHLRPKLQQQHNLFQYELRPQMRAHGVYLLDYAELTSEQKTHLSEYFEAQVFPVLTPLAVDPAHPFPTMSNLSLNLGVAVKNPKTQVQKFARVKVPNNLPRFIELPKDLAIVDGQPQQWVGVPLEDVIANNLTRLFPGMEISGHGLFRITRDADFSIIEDEADHLLEAIQEEISKRRFTGFVCRLEVNQMMPEEVLENLKQELQVHDADIYRLDGLLNLKDLFFFMSMPLPDLKDQPWTAVVPPRLKTVEQGEESIFSAIRKGDILLHHPYESFAASVQTFLAHAAHDPCVLTIKMTLYRTSGDSPIVRSLIEAAENGKQVVALVEIKARFDEANNIVWAQKLEEAGVHVVYGVVGLKTHTKTTLIVRRDSDRLRRYVHIGTGNYNPKTSGLYTDLGLMSCREELGADLTDLFNFLTGYSQQAEYRKLLVAPLTLRSGMVKLIEREIGHAHAGKPARIIAKMNSLVDADMIRHLYLASQAGVEVDLIVRGICCIRPGVPGISDRIRVISIVGRYLEHARIFYFANDGAEEAYIGSADWMPRNLDRRVEAVTPIEDLILLRELKDILDVMLTDNRQAWEMGSDGNFTQRSPGDDGDARSTHNLLMKMATERDQGGTIDSLN
jgi:polyphosphate kinase